MNPFEVIGWIVVAVFSLSVLSSLILGLVGVGTALVSSARWRAGVRRRRRERVLSAFSEKSSATLAKRLKEISRR